MRIPPLSTPMNASIAGKLPMQVSKAYGVTHAAPTAASHTQAPLQMQRTAEPSSQLVAGHVPGSVNFDASSQRAANAGVFQMYTRAADKVEAAVAVQIGRSLDVKG